MIRSAASKVMWLGRATVFLIGVAVILALVFGAVSTVSAHTGGTGFFHLGHQNVKHTVSKLVGRVAGPSLSIRNGSKNPKATALRLNVRPGHAPLKVNSDEKVSKLNSDKLDGKDSGAYLPGDLPPGKTVYGGFFAHGYATAENQRFPDMVSFGYRIPSDISVSNMHYIESGDPAPAGCSGDPYNPAADPGHMCFFETRSLNVRYANYGYTGGNGSNAIVLATSSGPGRVEMIGVWAVTAPTG